MVWTTNTHFSCTGPRTCWESSLSVSHEHICSTSLILGSESFLGMFLSKKMAEAQEAKPNYTSRFKASGFCISINFPLAKASQVVNPNINRTSLFTPPVLLGCSPKSHSKVDNVLFCYREELATITSSTKRTFVICSLYMYQYLFHKILFVINFIMICKRF